MIWYNNSIIVGKGMSSRQRNLEVCGIYLNPIFLFFENGIICTHK